MNKVENLKSSIIELLQQFEQSYQLAKAQYAEERQSLQKELNSFSNNCYPSKPADYKSVIGRRLTKLEYKLRHLYTDYNRQLRRIENLIIIQRTRLDQLNAGLPLSPRKIALELGEWEKEAERMQSWISHHLAASGVEDQSAQSGTSESLSDSSDFDGNSKLLLQSFSGFDNINRKALPVRLNQSYTIGSKSKNLYKQPFARDRSIISRLYPSDNNNKPKFAYLRKHQKVKNNKENAGKYQPPDKNSIQDRKLYPDNYTPLFLDYLKKHDGKAPPLKDIPPYRPPDKEAIESELSPTYLAERNEAYNQLLNKFAKKARSAVTSPTDTISSNSTSGSPRKHSQNDHKAEKLRRNSISTNDFHQIFETGHVISNRAPKFIDNKIRASIESIHSSSNDNHKMFDNFPPDFDVNEADRSSSKISPSSELSLDEFLALEAEITKQFKRQNSTNSSISSARDHKSFGRNSSKDNDQSLMNLHKKQNELSEQSSDNSFIENHHQVRQAQTKDETNAFSPNLYSHSNSQESSSQQKLAENNTNGEHFKYHEPDLKLINWNGEVKDSIRGVDQPEIKNNLQSLLFDEITSSVSDDELAATRTANTDKPQTALADMYDVLEPEIVHLLIYRGFEDEIDKTFAEQHFANLIPNYLENPFILIHQDITNSRLEPIAITAELLHNSTFFIPYENQQQPSEVFPLLHQDLEMINCDDNTFDKNIVSHVIETFCLTHYDPTMDMFENSTNFSNADNKSILTTEATIQKQLRYPISTDDSVSQSEIELSELEDYDAGKQFDTANMTSADINYDSAIAENVAPKIYDLDVLNTNSNHYFLQNDNSMNAINSQPVNLRNPQLDSSSGDDVMTITVKEGEDPKIEISKQTIKSKSDQLLFTNPIATHKEDEYSSDYSNISDDDDSESLKNRNGLRFSDVISGTRKLNNANLITGSMPDVSINKFSDSEDELLLDACMKVNDSVENLLPQVESTKLNERTMKTMKNGDKVVQVFNTEMDELDQENHLPSFNLTNSNANLEQVEFCQNLLKQLSLSDANTLSLNAINDQNNTGLTLDSKRKKSVSWGDLTNGNDRLDAIKRSFATSSTRPIIKKLSDINHTAENDQEDEDVNQQRIASKKAADSEIPSAGLNKSMVKTNLTDSSSDNVAELMLRNVKSLKSKTNEAIANRNSTDIETPVFVDTNAINFDDMLIKSTNSLQNITHRWEPTNNGRLYEHYSPTLQYPRLYNNILQGIRHKRNNTFDLSIPRYDPLANLSATTKKYLRNYKEKLLQDNSHQPMIFDKYQDIPFNSTANPSLTYKRRLAASMRFRHKRLSLWERQKSLLNLRKLLVLTQQRSHAYNPNKLNENAIGQSLENLLKEFQSTRQTFQNEIQLASFALDSSNLAFMPTALPDYSGEFSYLASVSRDFNGNLLNNNYPYNQSPISNPNEADHATHLYATDEKSYSSKKSWTSYQSENVRLQREAERNLLN